MLPNPSAVVRGCVLQLTDGDISRVCVCVCVCVWVVRVFVSDRSAVVIVVAGRI